jgi:hypothetical protein
MDLLANISVCRLAYIRIARQVLFDQIDAAQHVRDVVQTTNFSLKHRKKTALKHVLLKTSRYSRPTFEPSQLRRVVFRIAEQDARCEVDTHQAVLFFQRFCFTLKTDKFSVIASGLTSAVRKSMRNF